MIRALAVVLLAGTLSTASTAQATCDVAWRFTPNSTGATPFVEAEVSWRAANATESELTLTREWGGVDTFAAMTHDFRTLSPHQWVLDRSDPARKTITHLPNERVTVRYRIDARPSEPDRHAITRRDAYSAIVGPDWFHFTGYAALAVPKQFGDATRPRLCVTIDAGRADGWIVSSFGAERAHTAHYALRDSPDRLRHAVYFGGEFDVRRRDIHGHPVWVARRGPWRFDMDLYADTVARIISVHREFWNDFAFPHLAIELLHTNQPAGSSGGTALQNAFLMYAPDTFTVPGEQFDHLLGHEHLHTWLPRRFGSMGEDEELRYWFSEGFTDFYTHRLLVRAGVWTLQQYADALDRRIAQYLLSTARDYDNERVRKSFFSDPGAGALPYQRGELLALRWHSELMRRDAGGLDPVMRSLLLPQKVEEDARPRAPFATTRLMEALEAARLPHVRRDIGRHIDRGEPMAFDANTLGPCFEMRREDRPAVRLGFDRDSVKGGRLKGVEADGPAYAAGLRDGQSIGGFGLYEDDASKEAFVQLRDGQGNTSEVRFLPVSSERRSVPIYSPKPDAIANSACRAWFGLGGGSR